MLLALTWNWHFVIYSFEILKQENRTVRSWVMYEESAKIPLLGAGNCTNAKGISFMSLNVNR